VANDFNASLVISTSQAVTNVRSLDSASKDLDKTLAHLHTTMQQSQGDLDKVAKSLKVFNDTQRTALRDQKARDQALITSAKLEREQIVTKQKGIEVTNKAAKAEQDLANAKAKGGRAAASSLGSATRSNATNDARIANQSLLTNARLGTELERRVGVEQRTAAAIAQRAAAEDRAAMTALRLADAQARSNNANLALNDSLSNSRYLLYDVAQTYGVLSAALLAIPVATTMVASSYQKDFTQVLRTTGIAEEKSAGLYQQLQQLGTQIPLTFGEFSNIASIGGQLGIKNDELLAFTETVAKFGAATNVATADAATSFGRLENSFNADGKIPDFFNRVGSAIAQVGINSAASETEIIAVTNQISAAGAQFGFTADQIVGLSGALASVRIRPELARGAFQRIMLDLSRSADEGAASFDKFGKYTGLAADKSLALFKQDPSAFFNQYITGIKGTIDKGTSVSAVLDDIGAKNVFDKQFILGLANGLNVYNQALGDSASAFKEGTFLSENTAATFETFAAMLQRVGTAIGNLAARLGGGSLGKLEGMAHTVLNVVSGFDRLIQQQPAIAAVINTLLTVGAVTGVFLAFKAAQAFVLAGLVGLQQVMGKASIAGALTLRGNVSELAKTMLMAKGASAEYAATLLANKTAMQQLGTAAMTTRAQVAAGATAMANGTTITRNAGAATGTFASGLKGAGTAMLGLVGGPIGALVLGLGAVITMLISTKEEADAAGDAIARGMKNGADAGVRAAGESLAKIKVSVIDPIMIGNLDKSLVEVAKNAGVPFEKLALAATKGRDAGKEVLAVLDQVAQSKGFQNYQALKDGSFGSQNHKGELEFLRQKVTDIGNASQKTTDGLNATDDAVKKVGGAAGSAAPEADALKAGLEGVGGESEDAATKIQKAVDAIFGLVNAAAGTDAALSSLGEGLAKSTDIGTGTDGGRNNLKNFQDTLRAAAAEQQQLIDSGKQTAEQAAGNYAAFVDGLMKELASKGVDVAQVQSLAEQAKGIFGTTFASGAQPTITPKVEAGPVLTEVALTKDRMQQFVTANAPTFYLDANTDSAAAKTAQIAQSLAEITGYPYAVVMDALTNPASDKAVEIYDLLTSITNGTYVAPVGADTSTAIANVQSFSAYARQELANLQTAYNNVLAMSQQAKGFLRGAANDALGKGWEGKGAQTYFGPQPEASRAAAPAVAAAPAAAAPAVAQPNFGALNNGYNDAAKAAKGAGDAGKKAGKDMADGVDDAAKAAEDYANRLKTGLTSAFDKQYGLTKATDEYHSALNAIKKKRDDELAQIKDLIAKQKELNNARNADLITARKAGIEKAISQKYGEVDRAADYANQEQTALDAAAAKQQDIVANQKTTDSLKAGIDNFKGYSDAAIANREALRNLESKMLDMVTAYAATGASQQQVKAYAQRLTAQFVTDAGQVYKNKAAINALTGDMGRYIGVVNAVPRTKPVTVTANTGGAINAINGVKSALNSIPNNTTKTLSWKMTSSVREVPGYKFQGQQVWQVLDANGNGTGKKFFNKGGEVQGYAGGGMIPGRSPADPSVDNRMATVDGKGLIKVRSGEFIVQQPAVDYWGLDFFKTLNNMKMPAFNAGGSVGGRGGGAGSNGPVLVELTAENIAAIQRLPQINLYAESTQLASTVNEGNAILASQGAN
jgi:TP901 family phage tail tape measure protein